jgi:hypothetical protein
LERSFEGTSSGAIGSPFLPHPTDKNNTKIRRKTMPPEALRNGSIRILFALDPADLVPYPVPGGGAGGLFSLEGGVQIEIADDIFLKEG